MVKHIMADGTERSSIEGVMVPPEGKTEMAYQVIAGKYQQLKEVAGNENGTERRAGTY